MEESLALFLRYKLKMGKIQQISTYYLLV